MDNKAYKENLDNIFILSKDDHVICPPEQVFTSREYYFLFTIGGYLVDNSNQYERLMALFKATGENNYLMYENFGATKSDTEDRQPSEALIPIDSDFDKFKEIGNQLSPRSVGVHINHFYVSGLSKDWGIYICEYPTINIIGCTRDLVESFSNLYGISGNGFADLEKFIEREYYKFPHLLEEFKRNYVF